MSSIHRIPVTRRILIVDGHPLVRRGLSVLIDGEPDLMVCAATATHQEALDAIVAQQPDLVITELALEVEDGLRLIQAIRSGHDDLPVLVLSLHDAPRYHELALQAGASGYVSKLEMTETLLIAIRQILA